MLDLALNHAEELQKAMRKIWFNDEYKFYNVNVYCEDVQLANNTYSCHQLVSINKKGDVLGYISYSIDRHINAIYDIGIINFTDDKLIFGNDVKTVIKNVFKRFDKINFYVNENAGCNMALMLPICLNICERHVGDKGGGTMIRIYDAAPNYVGEMRKRFNKEFCDGILTDEERMELNNIYNRILELAYECKNRKRGNKNDG